MSTPNIDANVLLRAVVRDVPEHSDKVKEFIGSNSTIIISDIAIIETIFALDRYYGMPRPEIAKVIISLLNNPKFKYNKEPFKEAIFNYTNHPALSIEDCFMSAQAKISNSELYTFDKKLANQIKNAKLL